MSKGKWAEKSDGEGIWNPTCTRHPNQVEPQLLATCPGLTASPEVAILHSLPIVGWGASQVMDCPVI